MDQEFQNYYKIFSDFRKSASGNYYDYLNRIGKIFGIHLSEPLKADPNDLSHQKKLDFSVLKEFFSTYKNLNKIKSINRPVDLIVLNSKRFKDEKSTVRKNLSYALLGLPSSRFPQKFSNKISNKDNPLIIVDVMDSKKFVSDSKENLVVLNSRQLKLCFFLRAITFFIEIFKGIIGGFSMEFSISKSYFLLHNSIFSQVKINRAIFLTSNSLDIEMLRCSLLLNKEVGEVYEVMHGVPSKIVQTYFTNLSRLSYKMRFIAQIPNLNNIILKNNSKSLEDEFWINSYYTTYFGKMKHIHIDFSTYFIKTLKKFNLYGKISDSSSIALIIGGRTFDKNYTSTLAFQIEKKAINIFIEKGYLVLYSPHPFYKESIFTNNNLFIRNTQLYCIPDTVFCLLLSSKAFGIVSSVLFEASFLGLEVFTPMVVEDELFPREMLEVLDNPQNQEETISILNEFSYSNNVHSDVFQRAKERQKKLFTWN